MVTLHWTVNEETGPVGPITLVELVVENPTATPARIRVGNRLGGEIQPPRRHGVSEAGWDEGGFEGVVGAGERRALGYAVATGQDIESPPAEIVWTERAPETEESASDKRSRGGEVDGQLDIEPTAAGVVRALGDARPPADVVPTPCRAELPEAVESWLSAVETRIERHEASGGRIELQTVAEQAHEQELTRQVAADERALDTVVKRADRLRERIASTRETHTVRETI